MDSMTMGTMPYMAPLWLIYTLSAFFLVGFLFYYYRIVRVDSVKRVYGYHDRQNEGAHALCMIAMASALAPPLWQMPSLFWSIVLAAGAFFFVIRAVTFGRDLPYNKWWWDWTHVGMLLGMALMFSPFDTGSFSYVLDAFWLWFAGYYIWSLAHDLKEPNVYFVGSDVSHLAMGIVMFIMTAMPMALMAPGSSMVGMTMSICHGATTTPANPATSPDTHDMQDMPGMDMGPMHKSN